MAKYGLESIQRIPELVVRHISFGNPLRHRVKEVRNNIKELFQQVVIFPQNTFFQAGNNPIDIARFAYLLCGIHADDEPTNLDIFADRVGRQIMDQEPFQRVADL